MNTITKLANTLTCSALMLATGGLEAADRFDPSTQPLAVIAPIELASTNLAKGTRAYRTWFENGSWQGDLIEYTVTSDGRLSTTVDLSGPSPEYPNNPANWSANVEFKLAQVAAADYWDSKRKIITFNGNSQVAFRWTNLSDNQKRELDFTAFDKKRNSSDILDYIRGDRDNEVASGGSLRSRTNILGDIIHSNPVYVGPPSESYEATGYATWASSLSGREPRVYVGANDGMLHAFDAETGKEVYAYIPSAVMGSLDRLAGRPYSHLYSVDGQITVRDANADGWKTVLVAGLGAGGKDWFALDITDPDLSNESSTAGGNAKLLWELSDSDPGKKDDIGYSYGQAVIAQLNDGNWYAVMGNGYNSENGIAKLLIVDLKDGKVDKLISTGKGSKASPNGLSSPSLVDLDGDGRSDVAYAGDIDGNLWKFDLSSSSRGDWDVAYSGEPLHPGLPTQPITTAPDVSLHPWRGVMVFFATGRLFTQADKSNTSKQAVYGLWDLRGTAPPTAASQSLLEQKLSGDLTYTATDISEIVQTFTPEPGLIDWSTKDGWKVELPAGYHVLTPVQLRGGRVKASLHNVSTRENYAFEPYYVDGGAPPEVIFDLNRDDALNNVDKIDGDGDGDIDGSEDVVAMWKQPDGLMSQTTIGRISNGVDAQIINYLVPPVVSNACTGNCSAGFLGGHIDVDTDHYNNVHEGVGDKTHKHTHEYDKKVGRVYVDYRDHDQATGHVEIDNSGYIPQSDQWIVVVANADMSPGSVLTLDDRQYNVVEYQKMIQKKLYEWKGKGTPLTDDNNKTLIFSANDLVASGGTVRHDFDDMAILAGGLHPSNTGCVVKSDAITNGRYRNGALVTQFINLDVFTACSDKGCSLDKIMVQDPTDMPEEVLLTDETRIAMEEDLNKDGEIKKEDYEVFSGIRGVTSGTGDDRVLFESTLFWHYKGKACYGEDGWEAEVARVIDELIFTQEDFDELLAEEGITDLDAEESATLACIAEEEAKDKKERDKDRLKTCEKRLETIEELRDLETEIVDLGGSSDEILDSTGEEPVIMGGEASDLGVTAGPNFQPGRRTWTEVFND